MVTETIAFKLTQDLAASNTFTVPITLVVYVSIGSAYDNLTNGCAAIWIKIFGLKETILFFNTSKSLISPITDSISLATFASKNNEGFVGGIKE